MAGRGLGQLRGLELPFGGYQVDRLEHSLQCAGRAQIDHAPEEPVAVASLHYTGNLQTPHNHVELAAVMLKSYVSV